MIDVRGIRQDPGAVRAAVARRLDDGALAQFDRVVELDVRRREVLTEVEALRAERNEASREFGRRKQAGEDVAGLQGDLAARAARLKDLEEDLREFESLLDAHLLAVPNLLHADVPDGDASANREVRRWGTIPAPDFVPVPHWELGERLRLFDLPRGTRLSGSGFPLFTGMGARLVRGLANFLLDLHVDEHG